MKDWDEMYGEDAEDWGGGQFPDSEYNSVASGWDFPDFPAAEELYEDHGLKEMVPGLPNQLVMGVGLVCTSEEVSLNDIGAFLVVANTGGVAHFMSANALYQLVDMNGTIRPEITKAVSYWFDMRKQKEAAES